MGHEDAGSPENVYLQLAQMRRERDEARAELAASREAWAVELVGAQTDRDDAQRAYKAEAEQLRAALSCSARLTRERDEAIVKYGTEAHKAEQQRNIEIERTRQARAERDEARAKLKSLLARLPCTEALRLALEGRDG